MYDRRLDDLRERQAFINGLDIPAREMEMFLQTVDEHEEITMTDRDLLISATLESEVPGIGRLEMQKLTLTHLEGKELLGRKFILQLSAGQRDSLGQLPSPLTLGTFYVTSSEKIKDKDEVKVTAYNQTHVLATEYQTHLFTYPTTANELLQQICGALNIRTTAGGVGIDIDIEQDLYKNIHGIQYREIIEELAALTGSIARFNGRGDLELWCANDLEGETNKHHVKIPDGALLKLTELEKYGAVNSLVLARSPQNDNVAETEPGANPIIEATITNNQIIDKRREAVKAKLYPFFKGLTYYPFEAETSGVIGALVGDIVEINGKRSIVMGRKLTLDGGIKENLWCKDPARTKINYNRTSNIDKRIKNTELYVDKQEQVIRGVVSDVQTLSGKVNSNYAEIKQSVEHITQTVQSAGGGNLLKNSAFIQRAENGEVEYWDSRSKKPKDTYTSTEAMSKGSISGNVLQLDNDKISQSVIVVKDSDERVDKIYYSFKVLVKKELGGIATISVSDGIDTETRIVENGKEIDYGEVRIESVLPKTNTITVTLEASGTGSVIFSDAILNVGKYSSQWGQANGEILNTNVQMNSKGMIIRSSTYEGDYTAITPLEFAGYAKVGGTTVKAFALNKDVTEVEKLTSRSQIDMPPIKIVPVLSGSTTGWAFVKR